ncbi:MAG: response regulator [Desulfobacter sp.]|nr:response regulator [Desulfobacter sp.]WDP85303.1 MAG: response regulator [Desulfobacter sp.]
MNRKRVLIIDDENVICKGCKMILDEMGYACDHSLSGVNGLKTVMELPYDVLLLDMKLKDIDGMEILEKVKKAKPQLYVVVITGYSTVKNAVKAMKLGANDYISKPFNDDDIIIAVRNAFKESDTQTN